MAVQNRIEVEEEIAHTHDSMTFARCAKLFLAVRMRARKH